MTILELKDGSMAVNTAFLGAALEQGVWLERCQGCGDCVLEITGGICPIARCSKGLLKGPCSGSSGGKCEIDPEIVEGAGLHPRPSGGKRVQPLVQRQHHPFASGPPSRNTRNIAMPRIAALQYTSPQGRL